MGPAMGHKPSCTYTPRLLVTEQSLHSDLMLPPSPSPAVILLLPLKLLRETPTPHITADEVAGF